MVAPPPTDTPNRRTQLRVRWEALLRAHPASSPLAHPDALVHLLDLTLDRLFTTPRQSASGPAAAGPSAASRARPCNNSCRCGLNPLLAYFTVGEQALCETSAGADDDTTRLHHALRRLARDELETFCSLCQNSCAPQFVSPVSVTQRREGTDKARR